MKKGEIRTFVREDKEYVIAHGTHAQRHLLGAGEIGGRLLPDGDDRAGTGYAISYAMAYHDHPDVMA